MAVYHWLNRAADFVSRRGRILFVTPYARNVGNCAEEMLYALLKARRDDKRVMFLFPRPLFWKFRVEVANEALFAIESDNCVRNDGLVGYVVGWVLTIVYFVLRQAYLRPRAVLRRWRGGRLGELVGDRNNIFYVIPSIGRATLWQPDGARDFAWSAVDACNWTQHYADSRPPRLRSEHEQRGGEVRRAMGIPQDGWYVCLHVREGGYRSDWYIPASASRNCCILNYLQGIRAVTEAGGYVVRLGDRSMRPLPHLDGVIDYAHTEFKSELADIDLIRECRFYIGVNSGPLDVAWLFDKPTVVTNLSEWSVTFPRRKGDLAIFRHVFSRSRNRFLSLQELLEEPFEVQAFRDIGDDYVLVENTPEEIREAIVEFLNSPEGGEPSPLQKAFKEGRRAQIQRWLQDPGLRFAPHRLDDAIERYRLAAHREHDEGSVGRRYLERNWWVDETDTRAVPGHDRVA